MVTATELGQIAKQGSGLIRVNTIDDLFDTYDYIEMKMHRYDGVKTVNVDVAIGGAHFYYENVDPPKLMLYVGDVRCEGRFNIRADSLGMVYEMNVEGTKTVPGKSIDVKYKKTQ